MWVPRFHARFIRPVRQNIKAVIQAHEADGLAWANDGDPMEPFKKYRDAIWYNTLRPVCSVVSQRSRLAYAEDFSRIEQKHTIYVEIEDQGPDPDELAASVEKRVQAVDMIVRGATEAELMGALNPTYTRLVTVDIPDHDYIQFTREKQYFQTGSFVVDVESIEIVNGSNFNLS